MSDDLASARDGKDGKDRGGRRKLGGGGRSRPPADLEFDYKNHLLLRNFISETGKILPARMSRLSAKQQRDLTTAIKRARHLSLIPYCDQHA